MSQEITLTDANFEQEIKNSELPILVDFWAPWCGPCRFMGPVLSQLAQDWVDKLKIGKVNVDDNHITATKFGIQSIPTLILFKGGKVVDQFVGAMPRQALEQALAKHLE